MHALFLFVDKVRKRVPQWRVEPGRLQGARENEKMLQSMHDANKMLTLTNSKWQYCISYNLHMYFQLRSLTLFLQVDCLANVSTTKSPEDAQRTSVSLEDIWHWFSGRSGDFQGIGFAALIFELANPRGELSFQTTDENESCVARTDSYTALSKCFRRKLEWQSPGVSGTPPPSKWHWRNGVVGS